MEDLTTLAAITGREIAGGIIALIAIWVLLALAVSNYGRKQGYPWFPLFLCSLFLSWVVVLFVVTIANGPHLQPRPASNRWERQIE